jgi:transposase
MAPLRRFHDALRRKVRKAAGRTEHPSAAIMDAQSIRTSSNVPEPSQGIDADKKTKGRKRHIATDTLGLLLVLLVTAASVQDTAGGRDVVDELAVRHPAAVKAWADSGYQRSVIERGAAHGIDVQVVCKDPGQKGFAPLPNRWAAGCGLRGDGEGGAAVADSGGVPPRRSAPGGGAGYQGSPTGNHGPATLGQLVEDVSGQPLDRYFREQIFEPLGMASSDLVRSYRVRSRLATGYRLGSPGPTAVTDREWVTSGAASIYSTPRDMARYVAALLGGGANQHGSVLKSATLAMMFEPQYRPDPRIPGIGLAFFRANLGGHLAVEHPGIVLGFNSQILVAPEDYVGVIAFTNGAKGAGVVAAG